MQFEPVLSNYLNMVGLYLNELINLLSWQLGTANFHQNLCLHPQNTHLTPVAHINLITYHNISLSLSY
jgi:hypothetical protein